MQGGKARIEQLMVSCREDWANSESMGWGNIWEN